MQDLKRERRRGRAASLQLTSTGKAHADTSDERLCTNKRMRTAVACSPTGAAADADPASFWHGDALDQRWPRCEAQGGSWAPSWRPTAHGRRIRRPALHQSLEVGRGHDLHSFRAEQERRLRGDWGRCGAGAATREAAGRKEIGGRDTRPGIGSRVSPLVLSRFGCRQTERDADEVVSPTDLWTVVRSKPPCHRPI